MTRAAALVLSVSCVGVLVGCAGADDVKPAPTSTTTVSTSAPGAALPTAKKLSGALVTAEDLGEGWSEVAIETLGAELCGVVPLKAPGTTKARAEFVRVADSALVQGGLTAYPSGAATAAVAALRTATNGCTSYPVTVKNSATGTSQAFTVGVEPVTLPNVGDERLGLHLEVRDAGGKPQRTLYAVIRRADVIAALTVTGVKADRALFDRLLPVVDERFAKVAAP